ncbi:MAG TPA: insulinase family protein [Erysipelotrichaceae bacterium]|nr:insulinase family protein [Erysipelotrichaceae bacterium]
MRKTFKDINEHYDVFELENGLKLYVIQKVDYQSSVFYLGFPFGSFDLTQKVNEEIKHFPSGVAHFLEHKLFENPGGIDIMQSFSHLSCNVNAFTSYNETVYYFNSSKKSLQKPLNLLLNFVQNLSITEASVEKEKGIITQELRMYKQMPEQRLMAETYQSLYANHPVRLDIGGTEESVNATGMEDLMDAYRLNYHPANSTLVCVTPLAPELIFRWVKLNQDQKSFEPSHEIKRVLEAEPKEVVRPFHQFEMDIQASKITYSFKLDDYSDDQKMNIEREWQYRLFLELIFSPTNPAYEDWMETGRIAEYFGYEVEVNREYGFVMFYGENEDEHDFIDLIRSSLKTELGAFQQAFDLLKRRYYAQMLRSFDDQDDYAITLLRSHFNDVEMMDSIALLKSIQFEDILNIGEDLLNKPTALVKMTGLSKLA